MLDVARSNNLHIWPTTSKKFMDAAGFQESPLSVPYQLKEIS
jgi:hypothetical protein